jgi:hypothetical protein
VALIKYAVSVRLALAARIVTKNSDIKDRVFLVH